MRLSTPIGTWSRRDLPGLLVTVVGIGFAAHVRATEAEPAPRGAAALSPAQDEGCTAGCHGGVADGAVAHAPVAQCSRCHRAQNREDAAQGEKTPCGSGKTFVLAGTDPQLCLACHPFSGGGTELHPAVDDGCLTCHTAHSGERAALLTSDDPTETCGDCHDVASGSTVHSPVSDGECLQCHDPHRGVEDPLLRESRETLCLNCHDLSPADLEDQESRHAPVMRGQCVACHNPHATDTDALVRKAAPGLCLDCHGKDAKPEMGASELRLDFSRAHVHEPAGAGGCPDCHHPHASKQPGLLRQAQRKLCVQCHEAGTPTAVVHGAVKLGRCSVCHDPHTSERAPMMRFPDTQAMCFSCHSDDLTGRPAVHDPAAEDCLNCHGAHGGARRFNLAQGGVALCKSCHEINTDVAVKHRPLVERGCVACHDPHGALEPAQLSKKVNALCLSCHPQVTALHVPGTVHIGGHTLSGGEDASRPGRSFSCASCHNPHGSAFAKLLRVGGGGMAACAGCHFDGEPGAAVSQAPAAPATPAQEQQPQQQQPPQEERRVQ